MAQGKYNLALQALETLLHTTCSECQTIERKNQADVLNFLDTVSKNVVTRPYMILIQSQATKGTMGSDAARDFAGQVGIYYVRASKLDSGEKATYKRIEDWGADKADAIATAVVGWSRVSNGPFWVDEPTFDISAGNPANVYFLDKKLPFWALCLSVEFEVSSG